MNKDHLIELAFLALVFGSLLFIGPGAVLQHQLDHETPQFGAVDGLLYAMLSKHVAETGNYRYNPFYAVAGFKDSIAYHPPVLMHIVAMFSHVSGLNPYSSLSVILGVFVLFGAFVMYWLIRSYNKKIAMLSVPVFVFLYVFNFVIGYIWGEALLLMGSFFLIALFFLFDKQGLTNWWIPAGILIGATINTHTSETIFFYGFVAFFLGMKLLLRQLPKSERNFWLKQVALATLLALIIGFNYLIIFYNGYYKITGSSYTSFKAVRPEESGAIRVPTVYQFSKPVFYAMLIGAAIALVLARKHAHPALLTSGFMFMVGMSNYVGFHYRAFQQRFLWPITLALFFGITIYFIVKRFSAKLVVPAMLGLLLIGYVVHAHYNPVHTDVIYPSQWEGFKWVEQNTPESARTLFLYGDSYSQSLRIIKRLVFLLDPNDLAAMAQEGKLRRMIKTDPILMSEMYLIYRKGLFDFGYYGKEQNLTIFGAPIDLCGYDYYVVDRQSAYAPQFVQLTVQMANVLLAHNITPVFQNDQIAILKNNNVGGECLA